MGTVVENVTWANGAGGGTALNATNLNNFRLNLFNEFNGSISNANCDSSMDLDVSKLDFATMDADIAATRANTTTTALSLTCNSLTTGRVLDLVATTALTTGNILRVYSNGAETDTRTLSSVVNDNTAATGATCLTLQQDAAQNVLFIDQNANATAIEIDSEATSGSYILSTDANVLTTGIGLNFQGFNALTTGSIAAFESDSAETDARNLVTIHNNNTAATGTKCILMTQDAAATAANITNTANGRCLLLSSSATTEELLNLTSSGGAAHIHFSGDPANGTPEDGDMWFDGTNLKFRIGSTTYNIDMTSA